MEKKMNNKGFSLVELIIVIAIMAVLIGVLAPQYLKYVERSRVSTDVTNAQEIAAAVSAAIADGTVLTSDTVTNLVTKVDNLSDVKTKSTKGAGKDQTFYVEISDTKGVTAVYAGSSNTEANKMYPTVGTAYSAYVSGDSSSTATTP
jgi:type IV pilus assembly protein PilA